MVLAVPAVSLLVMLAERDGRTVQEVASAHREVAQLTRHEVDFEEGDEPL
jgi:urease gamma subunit